MLFANPLRIFKNKHSIKISLCLVFLSLMTLQPAQASDTKAGGNQKTLFSYAWQPGYDYVYRINLQDIAVTGMPGKPGQARQEIKNEIGLKGLLTLHCFSLSPEGIYRFGAKLTHITDIRLVLQGNNLAQNRKEVARVLENSRELIVEVGHDGKLIGIKHFLDNDPLYTRFIAVIAGEMQAVIKNGAGQEQWTAEETDYAGDALAEYTVTGRKAGMLTIKKRKDYYDRLFVDPEGRFETAAQSLYDITLNKKGYIEGISGSKHIVSESSGTKMLEADTSIFIDIDHIAENSNRKLNSSGAVDYDFSNNETSAKAKRRILAKKAGNLGVGTFLSWADQFDKGLVPDTRERFHMKLRMSARLELQPQLAEEIKKYILSKPLKTDTRRMLLSVLVSAGNNEAQQAILDILTNPFIRQDPEYYSLIQCATFLQKPVTDRLIGFYLDNIESDGDYNIRFGSIYTAGALINNLWKNRKAAKASAYNKRFVKNLSPDKPYKEQYAMLFGIRNTKLRENLSVVAPYLESENGMVRRAAVRSLGKIKGSQSRKMAMGMLTDSEQVVRNSALQTLLELNLTRADLEHIRDMVKDGTLVQTTDTLLMQLEKKYAGEYTDVVIETLEAMLKRGMPGKDAEIKTRQYLESLKRKRNAPEPKQLLKPQFR